MSKKIEGYGLLVYLENLLPESADLELGYSNMLWFTDILGFALAVSPLHSRDLDGRGNFKKPHYHVIFPREIMNNNGTEIVCGELKYALERIMDNLGRSVLSTYFEPIYHLDKYYEYLTHSDGKSRLDPSKANYTGEKLLWVNPEMDIPTSPVDYQQSLRSLYLSQCDGMDYGEFLDYIDDYYPQLTEVPVIYQHSFIRWVDTRNLRYMELRRVSEGKTKLDVIKERQADLDYKFLKMIREDRKK